MISENKSDFVIAHANQYNLCYASIFDKYE